MSFKSMIQDIKDEFGSISTKGFGSRLRSQWVVNESSMETIDDSKQSCWATMPPELLVEVLMRIERSESSWPSRKNVVFCASVCRSWRKNMKEIVKRPEISGKLTFPVSLKQPGSFGSPTQCYIERHRSEQLYTLYLKWNEDNDAGKFLLAAKRFRRATCTDYIISLNLFDISKGSCTYMGKLRSNFLGTKFKVYDSESPNAAALAPKFHSSRLGSMKRLSPKVRAGNYPVSSISYEVNALGSRGPRQMRCVIEPGLDPTLKSPNIGDSRKDTKVVLKNKNSRWHQQLNCWCLNFNGRVAVASVKNFQLVASFETESGAKEHENIILQFGKIGQDVYTMDYKYPVSAFQAFAICLSSFETKVSCE